MHSAALVRHAVARRIAEGKPGTTSSRLLAGGAGWSVKDIVCTHDRWDQPFEERHNAVAIALVLAGSFQYRSGDQSQLLAPGALMLGNYGTCFECGHEHAAGDHCVAFHFSPDFFERIAADSGHLKASFGALRVPPIRETGRLAALVGAKLGQGHASWDDIALDIAARALALAQRHEPRLRSPSRKLLGRVTESVRSIEAEPARDHTLQKLAAAAGVGPYYYLRVFERVTGVTPHQFVLRARLRHAALLVAESGVQIATIAFQSGFGDLSNFNHAFRAEFGVTPRQWRRGNKGVASGRWPGLS
jgi:AraC family transcriptional regulator